MIKAVIFDMDGVISDTQDLHAGVECDILARHGIKLTPEELTDRYAGIDTRIFFRDLLKENNVEADLDRIIAEKDERLFAGVREELKAVKGVRELIEFFRKKKITTAVASSSGEEFIRLILEKLKLMRKFGAVVSGDHVENSKPAPDIFHLAAAKINTPARECLVIEDGRSGMTGAKAAGMYCIGLVPPNTDSDYPADWVVESLETIPRLLSEAGLL